MGVGGAERSGPPQPLLEVLATNAGPPITVMLRLRLTGRTDAATRFRLRRSAVHSDPRRMPVAREDVIVLTAARSTATSSTTAPTSTTRHRLRAGHLYSWVVEVQSPDLPAAPARCVEPTERRGQHQGDRRMTLLNPDPTTLQLHSPALGPWFDDDDVTLPLPAAGMLDVALTLQNVSWLPPASGLLSFFIATSPRPTGIARLRGPDGTYAFARAASSPCSACCRGSSGASTPSRCRSPRPPTRPRPAFPPAPSSGRGGGAEHAALDMDALEALLPDAFEFPSGVNCDEDRAAYLGVTWDGSTFGNGPEPMTDLLQPGQLFQGSGTAQELLQFPTSTSVRLWAFDHRGRPLDAGAVAAWWNLLAGRRSRTCGPTAWPSAPSGSRRARLPPRQRPRGTARPHHDRCT